MRRTASAAGLLWAGLAFAQGPAPVQPASYTGPAAAKPFAGSLTPDRPAPGLLPEVSAKPLGQMAAAATEHTIAFDPAQVQLYRHQGRWQLRAGDQLVKDVGGDETTAREALRIVRELRLAQRTTIGTEPPFEYWLPRGGVPTSVRDGQLVPFDEATLRCEEQAGSWCIRDRQQVLFHFGQRQADAEAAFNVLKQHGFNRLGVVGTPSPVLTYFLRSAEFVAELKLNSPVHAQYTPPTVNRGLLIPGTGLVGEVIAFDARTLEVRRSQSGWSLWTGRHELAQFGVAEREARDALRVAQDYRFTEQFRLPQSGFTLYLCRGKPPRGTQLGLRNQPFNKRELRVVQLEQDWALWAEGRVLFLFGSHEAEARQALAVLQHFKCDQHNALGTSVASGLRFWSVMW
jgi:hypothetical protein